MNDIKYVALSVRKGEIIFRYYFIKNELHCIDFGMDHTMSSSRLCIELARDLKVEGTTVIRDQKEINKFLMVQELLK